MSNKAYPLDLSGVIDYDKEGLPKDPALFWGLMRKRFKNPDDYVSIRLGFTHLAFAHTRHAGPAQALVCELTGLQPEEIHIQSIRTVQKSTGVPIAVDQKELHCICCGNK